FFDVHAKTGSAIAGEALERIGALYAIEREIAGQPPDERQRRRQDRSRPLADALRTWAETILPQLSGPSDLAKAFRYMLTRWRALTRV
ncbi:transposase, partial [Methylobacterium sp. WL12]|uniref:IS66 family transposase n=2 Tax=Methylobacterium sp. WL12 TaxID=2603890 RepID=UPI0011C8C4A9